MTTAPPLDGLVAVVTGAGGNLGGAMATTMAEQGARVVVADVDGARAKERADAIASTGAESMSIEIDIANEESVTAAFGEVAGSFGGIDVLVNNAAPSSIIRADTKAADLDLATWDAIIEIVTKGALLCIRGVLPSMRSRGGGSIINIASVHAHAGDLNMTAYPVAKAAVISLSRVIATQYGQAGIRCNSVTMGTVPPPTMSEELRANRLRHQLIPRAGRPEDAASLVAYLASPAAGFITGADFVADGGVLAHLPYYAEAIAAAT